MNNKELVTCIVLTYNRHDMLDELVNCFIKQTHENKELIIINDEKTIKFTSDIPNVKIINLTERFNSLGEKREFSRKFANGKFICFFDDDDIYYSKHIEQLINNYKDGYDIIKNKNEYMTTNNENVELIHNVCFAAMLFSKEYVLKTKFNTNLSVGEDIEYIKNAKTLNIDNKIITFNYRWGCNIKHISGYGDDPKSWENCKTENTKEIIRKIRPHFNKKTLLYYE